jgi:hypothetical protein
MHEARVALWFVPHHDAPTRHPVNCRGACAVDHSERFVVTAVTCAVRAAASEILNTPHRDAPTRHPVNCRGACIVDHSERFVMTAVTCAVRAAASEILNTPHHDAPTRHPVNCRGGACAVDHSERFVVTAVTCAVRAAASEILNTWLRRSAVRRTSAYPAPQAGTDPRREHVTNSDDVFVSGTISGSRKRRGNGMLFWPTKHPRGTRWIRRAAGSRHSCGSSPSAATPAARTEGVSR